MIKMSLTKREKEILNDMLLGLSDKEIAEKEFIGLCTAKTHVSNIYRKLGFTNKSECVRASLISSILNKRIHELEERLKSTMINLRALEIRINNRRRII